MGCHESSGGLGAAGQPWPAAEKIEKGRLETIQSHQRCQSLSATSSTLHSERRWRYLEIAKLVADDTNPKVVQTLALKLLSSHNFLLDDEAHLSTGLRTPSLIDWFNSVSCFND